MKRLPFCAVFKGWPPYRIESRNLASLVTLAGSLTAELDADIGRLGSERMTEQQEVQGLYMELDETTGQSKVEKAL